MKIRLWAVLAVAAVVCAIIAIQPEKVSAGPQKSDGSQLQIIGKDGKPAGFVPLKHTSVKTEISGFVARIVVTQEFENVLPDAVEAIYVFPLPHDSAVDGMVVSITRGTSSSAVSAVAFVDKASTNFQDAYRRCLAARVDCSAIGIAVASRYTIQGTA